MLIGTRGGPRVVDRIDDDPRLALPGERPRHGSAEGVHTIDQQRIDVRLDRIEVGRQEEPRPVCVLLVNVVHDLRVPHVVERVHHQLRLDLGERVPIAVVVVPGVVMVQLGWLGALGGRAERAVVPVGDDRDPVRVERGHEPEDHVVENRAGRETGVARQPVREQRGRQVPAHLRRVNARRNEHDRLAVTQHLLRFPGGLQGPGVRELRVERAVAVQLPQVPRARDHERNEWGSERAVPQLAVPHAIARRSERLVVPHEGGPVGELPVVAWLEPQHGAWGRDPVGGDRGRAASGRRRATRLLRRGRGSGHGGDRHGDEDQQRAEHGAGEHTEAPPAPATAACAAPPDGSAPAPRRCCWARCSRRRRTPWPPCGLAPRLSARGKSARRRRGPATAADS